MANDHNIHSLSVEILRPEDPLLISERVAVAAFLASYSGPGRTQRRAPGGAVVVTILGLSRGIMNRVDSISG